mmetsp:Transcript_11059/g.19804  ORF Transcript_11059/g.19804 Transcript_11059/m.19804 type:complete len:714 (-) Transcript_11059:99-2240(-)
MPIIPNYEWEESEDQVVIYIRPKGVGKDKIDVYTTSALVKVNAERYLFAVDLKHDVIHEKTSYRIYDSGTVSVTVTKRDPGVIWGELKATGDAAALKARREKSVSDREQVYDKRLQLRKATKEAEEKRYFNQHWDIEKSQRQEVQEKVKEEYERETGDLFVWEEKMESEQSKDAPKPSAAASPAQPKPEVAKIADDVAKLVASVRKNKTKGRTGQANSIWGSGGPTPAQEVYDEATPEMREKETVTVKVSFTPSIGKNVPARGSHDGETYHQSRYKPKDANDTPIFYKEQGDQLYRNRQWRPAANMYSEALKRDTTYMVALCNRSACWLRMHNYKKAIDDANLALNLIGSSPASSTTAERYRYFMVKMLVRRGAASIWAGDVAEGLADYRVAMSYKIDESIDIAIDLQSVEEYMTAKGLLVERDLTETDVLRYEGDRAYHMQRYQKAADKYTEAFNLDPTSWECLANRAATYLNLQEWVLCLKDCDAIIKHCGDVALALAELQSVENQDDSDDEDGGPRKGGRNSELVKSSTKNVYRLIKAYVRRGAALCGLGKHAEGVHWLQKASAIVPYDNDLRDDIQVLTEKVRMDTIVTASGGSNKRAAEKAKERGEAAQLPPAPIADSEIPPDPLAAPADGPPRPEEFIACATYEGSKPGMVFKAGDQGTGYYTDAAAPRPPVRKGSGVRWRDEQPGGELADTCVIAPAPATDGDDDL